MRQTDTVARYGGEEFVVLMPNSKGREMEVAERIRKCIEETPFLVIAQGPVFVTLSGGVCSYPRSSNSMEELLDNADKGLYEAKTSGRNRVCCHGNDVPAMQDQTASPTEK